MADEIRGFLVDSARCLERRSYYRKLVVEASRRGINTILWHFTDDQGCSLQFDCAPEVAGPHAYSKSEMKALVRFARRHGITLVPELESLGHSRYLTNHPRFRHLLETEEAFTAICPVAPETRAIMRELLREVAEVFDSPWIHVGLDEVRLGGHPLTREALRHASEREIVADYVRFLHREVTALGRRMIIWGDRGTCAQGFLPLVPRDVVIADWEYGKEVGSAQIEHFLSLGFDVLLCPALITYDQPFLSGTQLGISNVRSMSRHRRLRGKTAGILGIVTTVWTPTRYIHDAQWAALAVAAELMGDADVPPEAALRRFLETFHGVANVPDELTAAFLVIMDLAPLRSSYLPLLQGAEIEGPARETLDREGAAWTRVLAVLARHRSAIRKNRRAYDVMVFAVRFLAFLGRRAVSSQRTDVPARRFLRQLETLWDRERHPDDPRKYQACFAFDREEHLLISFRGSLES